MQPEHQHASGNHPRERFWAAFSPQHRAPHVVNVAVPQPPDEYRRKTYPKRTSGDLRAFGKRVKIWKRIFASQEPVLKEDLSMQVRHAQNA